MWLSALYIWGCLLAFSACDGCPEPEDAASWLKLKPMGNCEDEDDFCPYRITLPPLSIQLPKPFRELEKMAKELQNLKEVVNRLRRDCQECKDRQRVERGGWNHGEDEERRTRMQNISSAERHNPKGEQMVRIVISTPPQDDTNHSSLERQGWNNDKRSDADTFDQSSEMSREVNVFDPSLEETLVEVKQTFSPIAEEIHRERKPDEFFESSIPRRKDTVQSVTHGSEMSREVTIFNPSLGETPEDLSEEKQVFSPTTQERSRERTLQEGELLESSIPRTKDFVQSSTHAKQQPNLFRERNVKNISGILAARRRIQNMTDTNGLNSKSGDANTKTVDLNISAGTRRIVNFSRAGGPLRPKTFINSRAKVSDEDRLRNPAAARMHLQGGDRTVRNGPIGTGFSPVRSGVMRVKETSPHIINVKLGTNNGLPLSSHDEKIMTNPKPGTNIRTTPLNEDEKMAIINTKPGTNSRRTISPEGKNMAIINPGNPKHAIKNGQIISTEDEKLTITSPKPSTNSRLTPSIDERMTIINPKLGTNSGLNPSIEDEIINPELGTNSGLNPSIEDENIAIVNAKPGTNSRLTPTTDDETMTTNPKLGTNIEMNPSIEDENIAIVNTKPGTNSRLTPSTDEKVTIINPKLGTNNGLNPSIEDENIAIVNTKPAKNSRLNPTTDDETMTTNPKLGTNIELNPSIEDENIAIVNPKPVTNSRVTPSTEDENMAIINSNYGIKSGQIILTEDEKLTIPGINSDIQTPMSPTIKPKLGTNSGLNPLFEDKSIAKVNPKPGTNSRLTPSTDDGKMTTKPGTNSRLTTTTEDENMSKINPNTGIKIGQIISTEDEKMTITSPKAVTNSSITTSTDEKVTIVNPNFGINSELNPSIEDENIPIVNPKPGTNNRLTLSTDHEKMMTKPKPGTNSGLITSTQDENMAKINLNPGIQIISTESLTKNIHKPMTPAIINPKLGTNSGLNPSTDENIAIVNPNPSTNSQLTPSTDDGKTTITNPKPGSNSRLTSLTDPGKIITNSKPELNTRLTFSTDDGKMTLNPKLGTNSRQTPSTYGRKMTTTNPKPGTNSRLTPSTHAEKMANKEYKHRDSDLRTDSDNDLKDARQVTVDEEENFRKLNKTVITRVPINMRMEDRGDVSHTAQTTNKSIFSVMNRAEQPNLIKQENEHMGRNASLVTSSTADSTLPGRQVDEDNYLVKETETGQEDLGSTILDTSNERETNPFHNPHKNETQLGTFMEKANEDQNTGTVKKDLLRNRKVTQLETDLVNPTLVPSVKITSADRKISTAGKIESPVAGQGTRIVKPGSISQPAKLEEDVESIQSINSRKNISKIREASNVRFVKNMPKLPMRPGRHPTTGGPKLHMINKGNSSVVLPFNSSISGRYSNFGRRNSSVMMKPSYVRRRPSFPTQPNTSRGFKANVSAVTHFIAPTGEISTGHTEEIKDNTQAIDKNTRTGSQSLSASEVRDPVGERGSESALTSKVVSGTEDSNNDNSLQTGASDSQTGGKESKQISLETTDQHPLGADSMKSLLKPQNHSTPSTQQKENEKTTDYEASTKHIPAVTNKHEDMVKNISQDTASTPVSFENTVATRELELIELNKDKVQKYSGDVLSNPNSVNDVRGNNGERYTVPVVLETLANVEEIKGSKVFSLSPEDTADGFKTIAVGDEVTQKEQAENKIQSTCAGDCDTTPTQQPTTQNRPPFEAERARGLPQDCADYITKARKNGVFRVTPRSKNTTFFVSCDMETSRGGWTLIQQRFNGNISFNRTWDEYKRGFGKLMGEFWLGNDKIHWLTQAKNMSLRIELEDFEGVKEYANYDHFHVANESQQYRLSIGGYSGTAGNALQFNKKYNHDQKLFTTPDRDNDLYPSGNCGAYYSSGWWFDACMSANLNGKYYHTKYKGVRNGIFWGTWHNITMEYYPTNERQSFKTVRMMIRPQNYAN